MKGFFVIFAVSNTSDTEENKLTTYKPAADTIKLDILQGQYEAAKGVNRIQLAVYFSIGKYISLNTRKGKWGTGALEAISQILRKELPGLRGFSATQLKEMRLFYEAWMMLDPNSSVATDEIQIIENHKIENSSVMTDELDTNSAIQIAELENYKIDIYQSIQIPETKNFPVEDFFKIPFTHHSIIRAGVKSTEARITTSIAQRKKTSKQEFLKNSSRKMPTTTAI